MAWGLNRWMVSRLELSPVNWEAFREATECLSIAGYTPKLLGQKRHDRRMNALLGEIPIKACMFKQWKIWPYRCGGQWMSCKQDKWTASLVALLNLTAETWIAVDSSGRCSIKWQMHSSVVHYCLTMHKPSSTMNRVLNTENWIPNIKQALHIPVIKTSP